MVNAKKYQLKFIRKQINNILFLFTEIRKTNRQAARYLKMIDDEEAEAKRLADLENEAAAGNNANDVDHEGQ